MFGRTVATEVTVPDAPVLQAGTPDPFKVRTLPLAPPVIWPITPDEEAKRMAFAVYEPRFVPPLATAKVPEVIFDASRSGMELVERAGMSSATMALNDGTPLAPSGEAKTLFAAWETKVMFTFPAAVTGELVAKTELGAVTPTEVTVPADEVAHAGAPDTTVNIWPFVPTEERPVPPWDTPKTPVMEEVGIEGMRAILNTPETIFEASRSGMEEVARTGMSDERSALNDGMPDDPAGAANTVPVACETKVAVVVPEDVMGLPDTAKMFGRTVATEVTPVIASVHDRLPPVVPVKTCPFDVGVDVGKVSVLEPNFICRFVIETSLSNIASSRNVVSVAPYWSRGVRVEFTVEDA